MNVTEAIRNCDFEQLYNRLTAYAYGKLKTVNAKDFDGIEPQDFVCNVIEKSLKGIRNWNSDQYSFEEFMFGSLKSDIDAFFKKHKKNTSEEILDFLPDVEDNYIDDIIQQVLTILVEERATDNEINMFKIWCEGVTKRKEISEQLEISEKEVDKARKRLVRKLVNVRNIIKI